MSTLDSLFPPRKSLGPGKPLGVILYHHKGNVVRCSHFSYLSNVVPLGLCDAGSCLSLTSTFKGFHNGVLSMNCS